MKKFGPFAALAMALALCVSTLTLSPANSANLSGIPSTNETAFNLSAVQDGPKISVLEGGTWKDGTVIAKEMLSNVICQGVGAAPCTTNTNHLLHGTMVAPKCEGSDINCIAEIYGYVNGQRVEGQFLGYTSTAFVAADPANGLFGQGRSSSRWRIPGVLNEGGTDTYMVSVAYDVNYNRDKFAINHFTSRVEPYTEAPRPGIQPSSAVQGTNSNGQPWISFTGSGCLWGWDGICGTRVNFAADQKIGLKLRFQNEISNWFQGRLNSPNISIAKFGGNAKTIDISGMAIKVPEFRVVFSESEITPKIADFMEKNRFPFRGGSAMGTSPDHSGSFQMVEAFRDLVKDTAAKADTHWYIANLSTTGSGCLASKSDVLGIVTTNSMVYQPEPPQFKSGYLEYSVGGLHYETDGQTQQIGTYDLIMKSSVARCLFNIPKVPISATVTVVNDKGSKTTSTTVVSEKDGWLKLRAAGFTFSNKTIKVKITKKKK